MFSIDFILSVKVKGTSFNLVAHFLKRHFSLRCIVKDRYGELRVFPERCVVCVSRAEDASARHSNPSQAAFKEAPLSIAFLLSGCGSLGSHSASRGIWRVGVLRQGCSQPNLHTAVCKGKIPDGKARLGVGWAAKVRALLGCRRLDQRQSRCDSIPPSLAATLTSLSPSGTWNTLFLLMTSARL
ncbi:Protein SLX4IP [Merluccius polli]|uniref:Protein SLX4IP n=1 Tax=Merluccius polli TaxID=89951 RepID=A0AA47ND56_MERPO|nr:Protein SLX4IP [Merluccius polli]